MSDKIKKEIKEFKSTNGNAAFTQKELLMYVVHKIDKMEEVSSQRFVNCNSSFLRKGTFYWIGGMGFALLGALAGLLLNHIGVN